MGKIPPEGYFYKSFKHLLTGKLTAREVLIFAIVHEWETTTGACFASRADIADRINESEATAERSIQLLIKEGHLRTTRDGRKRYLHTVNLYQVDTNEPKDVYQEQGVSVSESDPSVSKQGCDLYQVDTLIRSSNKIHNKIHNKINTLNESLESVMIGETDKEKEIRLHLEAVRRDPHGWEDHGEFLTKWDEKTRTTLRKPKGYQEKTWNNKKDYSDVPD